jgi:1,4-dihydroxy-6-naphthoate synthase
MTTAALVLQLNLPEFTPVLVPFDQIPERVADGSVDAGVVIHEGQLTYQTLGLSLVTDLGALWREQTGFPLPLGLDLVRRDLGLPLATAASEALRRSIEHAWAHREEAMRYALQYGRGLDLSLGDRFVGMYVNHWTLDMGETGLRALTTLLDRAAAAGFTPRIEPPILV